MNLDFIFNNMLPEMFAQLRMNLFCNGTALGIQYIDGFILRGQVAAKMADGLTGEIVNKIGVLILGNVIKVCQRMDNIVFGA